MLNKSLLSFVPRNEFGMEYELSAHTYLDAHRAEEDANVWLMLMNVPGDETNPFEVGDRKTPMTSQSKTTTVCMSASQNELAAQTERSDVPQRSQSNTSVRTPRSEDVQGTQSNTTHSDTSQKGQTNATSKSPGLN